VHPTYHHFNLPVASTLAAQFLALRTEEEQFIKRGNLYSGELPTFGDEKKDTEGLPPQRTALARLLRREPW
jgi:hypothetical protein